MILQPGDIVRYHQSWGVVREYKFEGLSAVDWWYPDEFTLKGADEPTHWYSQEGCAPSDLMRISHESEGIPDAVLAKATEIVLLGDLTEGDA
jgi:hypothetical protein